MKLDKLKLIKSLAGIFLGALFGYIYFYFWGCTKGCMITSNPITSILYGALIGGVLFFKNPIVKTEKSE